MKRSIQTSVISSFLLLFTAFFSTANAGALPAGFDAAKWAALLNKINTQGTPSPTPDGLTMMSLGRKIPTGPKTFDAQYISTIGYAQGDGTFVVLEVSAVSESWSINADGNSSFDQYIDELSNDGYTISVTHSVTVETPAHEVVSSVDLPTGGAEDATQLSRIGAEIKSWY